MSRKTTFLNNTPLLAAIAALHQNAEDGDRAPTPDNQADLDRKAAILCRRSADEIDRRP